MSGTHAYFSPSSAARVITCAASFLATKDLPDTPNFAACEGTVAHYIHEQCLKASHIEPSHYEGMRPFDFMPWDELTPAEWDCIPNSRGLRDDDYIWTSADSEMLIESILWCQEIVGEHYVEQRVNISKYTPIPDQFGTADHFVIEEGTGILYVTDLKWGKGVKVFAERNYQGILYALGVIEEWDWLYGFDKVVIRIAQPRLDHYDTWETTAEELRAIGRYILERFTLAMQKDAPFNPEEKACQFCKLKPECKALAQRTQQVAHGWFDDLDAEIESPKLVSWPISSPDSSTMTADEIAQVIAHADLITGFLDAVKTRAVHMLMHSQPVPGYKIVEGRTNRVIVDPDGYCEYLQARNINPLRDPELISLTEAETKLKKKKEKAGLAPFLKKPKGAPTLALESDKREAYAVTADDMFDVVTNSDDDL